MFRGTFPSKQFALRGFQNTLEHFTTLRGFWIRDPCLGYRVAPLCIPCGVFFADSQCRLRNESQPAPFEVGPQLEDLRHDLQRCTVALPRNDTLVLVLDLCFARFELSQ